MPRDDRKWARIALGCLDLTRLGDDDDVPAIASLLARADGPAGTVAAVCLWPRFVAQARARLDGTPVKIATVVNFPGGSESPAETRRTIETAIANGADEIDTVLPWRAYLSGDTASAEKSVRTAREATGGRILKVILETGALKDTAVIRKAAKDCLVWGADFLKTSTGKGHPGASPEAVRVLLDVIRANSNRRPGLKVSGGIRTLRDARVFIDLVRESMGEAWLDPATFRIGASGLLDDIERTLGIGAPGNAPDTGDAS